jgi:hypothetical protein
MDLAGLDDENLTRARFELLAIDGPEATAFPDELNFIVRMAMGARTTPGKGAEEEHGDIHVAVIGPDELVRAALKGQLVLTDTVHPLDAPLRVNCRTTVWLLARRDYCLDANAGSSASNTVRST